MSVLVHDLKTFKAVYNKAVTYKFNRTCNIDYCNTLSLEDGELQKHVTNWCYLNEWSFNRKYKGGNILPYLYQMLTFKYKREKINTYQMLKYLSSIYYNIELDTIKIGRTGNEPIEIDSFDCKIPEISTQIDWGAKKRGQGRRSGGTILGSMSAAPYGIKTYYSVDISKYLKDWPSEVFKYLNNPERARYYKAREYK